MIKKFTLCTETECSLPCSQKSTANSQIIQSQHPSPLFIILLIYLYLFSYLYYLFTLIIYIYLLLFISFIYLVPYYLSISVLSLSIYSFIYYLLFIHISLIYLFTYTTQYSVNRSVNNELKSMWKWCNPRCFPGFYCTKTEETQEHFRQDSRYLGRDSKPWPLKYHSYDFYTEN